MTKAHISRHSATHHPRGKLSTYYLSCFDKLAQKQDLDLTEQVSSASAEELEQDEGPAMTMGGMGS